MFKALLAASIAMLACCVAAVWAGPVQPAWAHEIDAIWTRSGDGDPAPRHVIQNRSADPVLNESFGR